MLGFRRLWCPWGIRPRLERVAPIAYNGGARRTPGRTVRAPARSLTWGELPMEPRVPRPDTIQALRWGADAAFALLAGLQLDVFTPLQGGPLTPAQLAEAIGVGPARLRLLLYALVAPRLLTEQDGRFANTPEAQYFLVQGTPTSLGRLHHNLAAQWAFKLHTATSIQTGVPQAHLGFTQASPEALEAFLRRINVSTVAAAQEVAAAVRLNRDPPPRGCGE